MSFPRRPEHEAPGPRQNAVVAMRGTGAEETGP